MGHGGQHAEVMRKGVHQCNRLTCVASVVWGLYDPSRWEWKAQIPQSLLPKHDL